MNCNKKKLDKIAELLCHTKDLSRYMSYSECVSVELGEHDYFVMAIAAFALISKTLEEAHNIIIEM